MGQVRAIAAALDAIEVAQGDGLAVSGMSESPRQVPVDIDELW
ncbi:hypothetical protein [Rhodococcus sp. ACS1]|nr:hypothetical protein [Rhodococcus sp. ACS1]